MKELVLGRGRVLTGQQQQQDLTCIECLPGAQNGVSVSMYWFPGETGTKYHELGA